MFRSVVSTLSLPGIACAAAFLSTMNAPYEEGSIISDSGQVIDRLDLHSSRTFERLNQIDRLHVHVICDHISPPQLVVCSDQSVGKTSFLEGISGTSFLVRMAFVRG